MSKNLKLLIAIEVLFRLILFFVFYSTVTIYPDSEGYLNLAKRLSNFDLTDYDGLRSPGYPMLISFVNSNLYAVIFIQFGLGIVTSIFQYKTFIHLNFSKRNGLIITLFISSFLNVFFFETCVLVETFVLFLMSAFVYLLSKTPFQYQKLKLDFLMSFILGYLVLIKSFYIFIPFLLLVWLVFNQLNLKCLIRKGFVILIFPTIAFLSWSYVNKINIGQFSSSGISGLYLAQNCVYFAEDAPKEFDWISKPYVAYREKSIQENRDVAMTIWYAYEDGAYDKYNLSLPEFSAELGKFAKATIKENPIAYLKQVITKSWFDFWKPTINWNYEGFNFKYASKLLFGVWYLQSILIVLIKVGFIFVFGFQLIQFLKNRKLVFEFLLSSIVFSASVLQALATYGTNNRFSFPFEFIMIITVLIFLKANVKLPNKLNTWLQ
ncbi:hypothetical protein [Flavobacterium lacisediminis]|uniref:Glycosyltransferase RgtA/B/C/D-like domain-containing protein n=1 Tax=Flavobacterium lacisediminis TaxID=2989705 RepID=A0ABT3EGB8_9FLAO|nr:hypothetical protein [Flavobacterium lacisediminis]MCW1147621.1 hypothetical protein [Flavobacterium lacisediminis]